MKPKILLGDEAVALGAIHAGLSGGYSYPGTPASEIMEYLIKNASPGKGFQAFWCVNEKVAYEEALGVSFAGKRALVSMKHVGLNVAADPFMNSAITGTNGGLVVVVADDPSMHSSQNEQDSRYFAQFAQVFCLEPSNHQEAYDMAGTAFHISEKLNIPVMIRLVTRLSHSRSYVMPKEARGENSLKYGERNDWTLLPVNARRRFKILVEKQPALVDLSNQSKFNNLTLNKKDRKQGIIASGIAYNYVREIFPSDKHIPSILKINTYPLPEGLIKKMVDHVDTLLVVEEGYPFIEKNLKALFRLPGKKIKGKLSGQFPLTGELSPDLVRQALEMPSSPLHSLDNIPMAARPPKLCQGCPHTDTFHALNKALEAHHEATVFSDIGCYTLGALPPLNAVDTCVCMGASVSMAKGGADAGIYPSVGVIGDSTFAHSGITPLLDAARENTNMTVIILDNGVVAMTGGQPTFATGKELERIVEGVGVNKEHIRVITPLPKNKEENIRVMKEEINHQGISVIIASRECIHEVRKRKKKRG